MKRAMTLLVLLTLPLQAIAVSHGPVFGLATPTNSQGEWSFDQGLRGLCTRRARVIEVGIRRGFS
jgi:hypothetical protein